MSAAGVPIDLAALNLAAFDQVGFDLVWASTAFSVAGAMTPGPNNVMLMASGVNFGFARTLPHIAGVVFGYSFLIVAAGVGVGAVFAAYAPAWQALRIAGAIYLLWLAWKVVTSGPVKEGEGGRPLTGQCWPAERRSASFPAARGQTPFDARRCAP